MLPIGGNRLRRNPWAAIALASLLPALATCFAGCSRSDQPGSQEQSQTKRYHLVGKVVLVDQQQASLMVDGQEIPGFMAAMTMPYPVRDTKALGSLGPGDEITADVVVAPDGAYLENIVVTKKGDASAQPKGASHQPAPGEKVPDFALIDQDGKRIHLSSYRGDVLLVTFIYTRCPFPTFCPLVSKNFATIYADLHKNPALGPKIRLLSVSFDSAYDTPAVLRKYADTFSQTTNGKPFDRWEFATASAKDLPQIADFFGLYYTISGDQIVHSMSTAVISPEGTIYKWYDDNNWTPADLIQDATQSLQQDDKSNAGPAHIPASPAPQS